MFRSRIRQASRPAFITWMMSALPSPFTSTFCASEAAPLHGSWMIRVSRFSVPVPGVFDGSPSPSALEHPAAAARQRASPSNIGRFADACIISWPRRSAER